MVPRYWGRWPRGGTTLGRVALGVSPKTVHNHASNIITKLHVSTGQEPFSGRETRLGRSRVGLNYPAHLVSKARVPSSMIIDDECARCH